MEPASSFCRDSYGLQKLSEKVPGQADRTYGFHLKNPLQNHTAQLIDRPHNCSLETERISKESLESSLYSSPIKRSGDGSVDLENLPISALHCGSNASTNRDKNILFAGNSYDSESIEVKKVRIEFLVDYKILKAIIRRQRLPHPSIYLQRSWFTVISKIANAIAKIDYGPQ